VDIRSPSESGQSQRKPKGKTGEHEHQTIHTPILRDAAEAVVDRD
jgi:hypothetical protein